MSDRDEEARRQAEKEAEDRRAEAEKQSSLQDFNNKVGDALGL